MIQLGIYRGFFSLERTVMHSCVENEKKLCMCFFVVVKLRCFVWFILSFPESDFTWRCKMLNKQLLLCMYVMLLFILFPSSRNKNRTYRTVSTYEYSAAKILFRLIVVVAKRYNVRVIRNLSICVRFHHFHALLFFLLNFIL